MWNNYNYIHKALLYTQSEQWTVPIDSQVLPEVVRGLFPEGLNDIHKLLRVLLLCCCHFIQKVNSCRC